ncbi:hypothetical protein FH969_11840 [Miniimonas arenae]|uniref:PAS domain-containing sensor histidine kinase n=1 Tax=Miniimonas arenae TaxID=676201 RepID=A0A5C5B938_9MICO|nr:hypothetical protein [Miniimonas arenae]TNU73360.1 hypothetical protein FH969_11840 [Miniimonas arenae]
MAPARPRANASAPDPITDPITRPITDPLTSPISAPTAVPRRWGAGARTILPSTIRSIQLLLAGAMVVSAGLVAVASTAPEPAMLVWGLMIGAVATALAMLAPWGRAPVVLLAVVQLLDVVAVGFLREASPPSGLGLLWTFPVMWAAWVFGTAGACLSVAFVSLTYWGQGVVNSGPVSLDLALVFPATVAVLAAVTTVVGRLTSSQRTLLERQSVALRAAMARAHRQEALVTDVLDAVDFGVVGFDAEGTVTLSNDAQQRLEAAFAEAGPDAYGPDGFTALDPDDLPTARALRGETFEGALVWYGEPGSP